MSEELEDRIKEMEASIKRLEESVNELSTELKERVDHFMVSSDKSVKNMSDLTGKLLWFVGILASLGLLTGAFSAGFSAFNTRTEVQAFKKEIKEDLKIEVPSLVQQFVLTEVQPRFQAVVEDAIRTKVPAEVTRVVEQVVDKAIQTELPEVVGDAVETRVAFEPALYTLTPYLTPVGTSTITPIPEGVVVVRVEEPQTASPSRGFFTTIGLIVAFVTSDSEEVTVFWHSDGQQHQAQAQVLRRGDLLPSTLSLPKNIALLQLIGTNPPSLVLPIRLGTSLKPGDRVERYIAPHDRTPGTVLEIDAERAIVAAPGETITLGNAIITTRISAPGDIGAPVTDSAGRVVAMTFASSTEESVSIPIESIKAVFPEAFE
jgi:hypothetical protein